ncbi:putative HIT-like protein slr1234 isoform X2 [Zonotrichia albicollis]|uniref:putative HIT-like protein slr1234 isoform X2 n=1 Tax=Zonotrichia albicollis TaxID=44394 RepID=UPI003D80CCE7
MTGETANRDAGHNPSAQWAPRRARLSGGSGRGGHGRCPWLARVWGRWPLALVAPLLSSERLSARRFSGIVSDEDEECRTFHDLLPLDGTFFLVMPKEPIIELSEAGGSGESCRTFHDLLPLDGTFFLVMPKEPIIELSEAGGSGESLLEHVMIVGEMCVAHLGLTNGFRMVVDEGPEGGQSVYRIHLPVLGGRQLGWPPG